jgi:hypothetical protein
MQFRGGFAGQIDAGKPGLADDPADLPVHMSNRMAVILAPRCSGA